MKKRKEKRDSCIFLEVLHLGISFPCIAMARFLGGCFSFFKLYQGAKASTLCTGYFFTAAPLCACVCARLANWNNSKGRLVASLNLQLCYLTHCFENLIFHPDDDFIGSFATFIFALVIRRLESLNRSVYCVLMFLWWIRNVT